MPLLKAILAEWKAELLQGRVDSTWPYDPASDLRDVEIASECRPLLIVKSLLKSGVAFEELLLVRHGIDSLEVYRKWDQDFDRIVHKLLNACTAALNELKSNPQFGPMLIAQSRKRLGISPLASPEPMTVDATPQSDGSQISMENFVSYDDPKMIERDHCCTREKKAGATRQQIIGELAEIGPGKGWPPITSTNYLNDRIVMYANASNQPVPRGLAGKPLHRRKSAAKREKKTHSCFNDKCNWYW